MSITRRAALVILVASLNAVCLGVACADEASSAAMDELKTLRSYGASHKTCQGWTDGCALCARRADGSLGCTRMGVGCEIAAIQCTQRDRDPKTGKTPAPAE